MNIDSNSNTSPCKVTSKYFTKTLMDDSLIDFQEAKKSCTGPKSTKTDTKHIKRVSKRIKGQKDIRTVLKAKKNELVAYAKEFDIVCKKSGIDVDSEQLQLAIALSKSLQTEQSCDRECSTSQEKTKKIRTTLQEYGFKVPDIKTTKKISKKHKKNYKLIVTEETKKLEIISERYSEVLFHCIDNFNNTSTVDNSKAFLYHMTTNVSYNQLKNNNIFYFSDFIEKSTSNSCLLRDWADIPGRPVSPKHSVNLNMDFSEIACSQEVLDTILSGSCKNTKKIIESKWKGCHNSAIKENNKRNSNKTETSLDIDKKIITIEDLRMNNQPIVATQFRSCSPDIFEEDVSSLIDITKSTTYSQENKENTDYMDLTECVNICTQNEIRNISNKNKSKSQLSQKSEASKRKSDDFMEMTECVASSSQPVVVVNNIDLTQSMNVEEITIRENNNTNNDFKGMDLTQSSDSSEDLPVVQLSGSNKNVLNINETLVTASRNSDNDIMLNLTQNRQNSSLSNHGKNESFFEEFVHNHSDSKDMVNEANNSEHTLLRFAPIIIENEGVDVSEHLNDLYTTIQACLDNSNEIHIKNDILKSSLHEESQNSKEKIDLTSSPPDEKDQDRSTNLIDFENRKINTPLNDISKLSENSGIDLTQSSDSTDELCNNVRECTKNENYAIGCSLNLDTDADNINEDIDNHIDLTQSSCSSNELENLIPKTSLRICNNSSLGKKDDVSIDYDEMFNSKDHLKNNRNNSSVKSVLYEVIDINDSTRAEDENLESSQNNEVFMISDREFDYSLHQSKHENFHFGGISIMNDFPSMSKASKSYEDQALYNNLDESEKNDIDTKKKDCDNNETEDTDEAIYIRVNEYLETPKNKDYIIKTDNITPMLDYASMSTPQRNRELDKYGLKPFKRKRAIQILTHVYNQTHPIVKSLSEDLSSPSKKQKKDTNHTSPNISPKKLSKSPRKRSIESGDVVDAVLYEITNEVPDIKEVDCCDDDWVFQKREKAKVHSCRVPLHIAFHNYVSCRRGLREAILRYEPVNIDIIHKELVGYGHRYDPKELLRFMDKKCITVKTSDNNARNNRY